jgi:hypothetical protein
MCTLAGRSAQGSKEGWAECWYLAKAARSSVEDDLGDERQVIRG